MANLVCLGTLPSGGALVIHRLAAEADLLVAEGFIEPHFFAGFSGGRKSVLPGIAGRKTVLANHCAAFIDDPRARTGACSRATRSTGTWSGRRGGANLAFVVNAVIDHDKQADCSLCGRRGARARGGLRLPRRALPRAPGDGGPGPDDERGAYPLDQNLYQAVKGMTAAEATVRPGGVILMMASCADGCGGEAFYRQISGEADLDKTLARFRSRRPEETEPDQWQSQILIRVLQRATVLLLSEAPDELVRAMHMVRCTAWRKGCGARGRSSAARTPASQRSRTGFPSGCRHKAGRKKRAPDRFSRFGALSQAGFTTRGSSGSWRRRSGGVPRSG